MEENKHSNPAEIIIIGAGAAGLAAAVTAAEHQIGNVTVIETRPVIGGNAVFAMGMFAAETRLQRSYGVDAHKETLFRKAMDYGHWRTNPRLVRRLIDHTSDTVDWLESYGLQFKELHPGYANQTPVVFHFLEPPKRLGAEYVKTFSAQCESKGITVMLKTKAKKLLCSDDGSISGVLVESEERGEISLPASAVILATGGFLGNQEILQTYLPGFQRERFHFAGIPHSGDGLQMAAAVGASSEGMIVLEMNGPVCHPSNFLSVMANQPSTLWVNRRGERFTDESLILFPEKANCLYRQPGRCAFTVFDEAIKQQIYATGLNPLDAMMLGTGQWAERVDEDLSTFIEKDLVQISSSLDVIAQFIGAPRERFQREIERYNAYCTLGYDALFGKDRRYLSPLLNPPYYAIKTGIKLMTTHGGSKVNELMGVVDENDDPISGLYAAGVETGATDAGSYDAHLTGHSFGFSVVSGRIAGESAAAFVQGA